VVAPPAELGRDNVERLLPGGGLKLASLSDQGRGEPLRVPCNTMRVATLDAEMLAIRGAGSAVDASDVIAFHPDIELASHSAVRAGRAHGAVERRFALLSIDIGDGARRARLDARSACHAGATRERTLPPAQLRLGATTHHRIHEAALDFLTRLHAFRHVMQRWRFRWIWGCVVSRRSRLWAE
jgi:hypothetical protein